MITLINALRREMEERIALDFSEFLTKAFLHIPAIACDGILSQGPNSFLTFAIPGCLT